METNLKFDARECLKYINQVEDFEVEFERKPTYDMDSGLPVYIAENMMVKAYLKNFVIQCTRESLQQEYDFLHWLNERRLFFKSQQERVVNAFIRRMMRANTEDRPFIKRRRKIYENFFAHMGKLIDVVEASLVQTIDKTIFGQLIDVADAPEMHPKKTGAKLAQQDYALLCAIESVDIRTYISNPSKKLLQHCSAYKDRSKRIEILPEMSKTVAKNVRNRYERVIPHLKTDAGRKRGKEELVIVCKKIKETHFSD